jgi:hypothetical protein
LDCDKVVGVCCFYLLLLLPQSPQNLAFGLGFGYRGVTGADTITGAVTAAAATLGLAILQSSFVNVPLKY